METRMEKYYKTDINEYERTKKNANLYRSVSDEISSLDSLPVPDTSKEIDINGLKEIISSRGDYRIQKEIEKDINDNLEELKNIRLSKNNEEKIYDINILLENAKNELHKTIENDNEIKKNISNNFLNDIKDEIPNNSDALVISNQELKKEENDNLDTNSLALDELMDLKGNDNTVITDPIVKEEVVLSEEIKEDETFYSGSLHFDKKDFEDDDNNTNKSHDGLKIFFLVFGILLLIAVIALIIYKYVI